MIENSNLDKQAVNSPLLLSTSSSERLYIPDSGLKDITLANIHSLTDGVTWIAAKSFGFPPEVSN
jgi:hypothetical protein